MTYPEFFNELPFQITPWLIGLLTLCLLLTWRWRWRDYLLPFRINKHIAQDINGDTSMVLETAPQPEDITAFARPVPQVSLVIPCCNQVDVLRQNLPIFLSQNHQAFEIIIVDEASTDETIEFVNYLSSEHPNLRSTFIPATSRYVDRRKLAITLGIRAARAPWVVITEANCQPVDASWLSLLSSHFSDEIDFVLGYANYINDGSATARSLIFNRLLRQIVRFRAAIGFHQLWSKNICTPTGKAFGGDIANMAVRKSWFLSNKGYADSLTVSCGEDDLLIDALSRPGRTAIETRKEATIMQTLPKRITLTTQETAHRETLHCLSAHGHFFRYRESAATWTSWLFLLTFATYLFLRTASLIIEPLYSLENLPYDITAVLLAVLNICLPGCFLRRSVDSLGERRFCWIGMSLHALAQPFHTAMAKIRRFSHRHDFIRR